MAPSQAARLILITSFTLGAAAGGVAVSEWMQQAPSRIASPPSAIERLTQVVKLDPQQRFQVESILTEARQQFRQIDQQCQSHFAAIRLKTRERVRCLLSPKQQALYDQWERERKAKYQAKAQ